MDLTPESIEEFHTAKHSLLLGEAELSSLKSEVKTGVSTSKKLKKHGQRALGAPHISVTSAGKKGAGPGGMGTSISPVVAKRKATPADLDTSTVPMKKVKGS